MYFVLDNCILFWISLFCFEPSGPPCIESIVIYFFTTTKRCLLSCHRTIGGALRCYHKYVMYRCCAFSLFYIICRAHLPLMLCVKSYACIKSCCVSKPPCRVSIPLPGNVLISINVACVLT